MKLPVVLAQIVVLEANNGAIEEREPINFGRVTRAQQMFLELPIKPLVHTLSLPDIGKEKGSKLCIDLFELKEVLDVFIKIDRGPLERAARKRRRERQTPVQGMASRRRATRSIKGVIDYWEFAIVFMQRYNGKQ